MSLTVALYGLNCLVLFNLTVKNYHTNFIAADLSIPTTWYYPLPTSEKLIYLVSETLQACFTIVFVWIAKNDIISRLIVMLIACSKL